MLPLLLLSLLLVLVLVLPSLGCGAVAPGRDGNRPRCRKWQRRGPDNHTTLRGPMPWNELAAAGKRAAPAMIVLVAMLPLPGAASASAMARNTSLQHSVHARTQNAHGHTSTPRAAAGGVRVRTS